MTSYRVGDENKISASSVQAFFFAPNNVETVKTEYLIYDLADLAGSVGGMLGMLLGISVSSVYDQLVEAIKKTTARLAEKP